MPDSAGFAPSADPVEPIVPTPSPARPSGLAQLRTGFTLTIGGLIAVAVGRAVLQVTSELLLVLVAAFIAVGLEPLVDWLVSRGMRRGLAVSAIVVTAAVLVGGFVAAAVPPVLREANQLIQQAPAYLQQLQDRHTQLGRLKVSLGLSDYLQALAGSQLTLNTFGGLFSVGATVVSYTFQLVVVLVLVIYFLADFPAIKAALYRLAPRPYRHRLSLLGDQIVARTGGYVLGNLLTSVVAGISQYVVLRLLGVPFALALAVFVAVFDLVPMVGSTIAGVVVTAVTLATVSTTAAVLNVVFTLVYRVVEDYVLSPRVLARTVEVKAVVTVIAVLLGGALLGIEGALVAVPVAAAVQLVVTEVVYPRTDAAGSDR